jgi:hypothetical protein
MSKVFEFREWLIQLEEGVHEDLAQSILLHYSWRQTGPPEERPKMIVDALKILSDISPEPKYLPVLAYFVAIPNPLLRQWSGVKWARGVTSMKDYINKFKSLVDRNKLVFKGQKPDGHVDKDGVFIGMPAQQGKEQKVDDWLKFTEMVDGIYNSMRPSKSGANDAQPIDADPVFSIPGKIDIYEANSQEACIKYGQEYGFCISHRTPEKNAWQSYRDTASSTFYFVMDRTLDKSNPLHMVVVNVKSHGIELTDASNRTGNIAQFGKGGDAYMKHLIGRGVPTERIFKNIPKTEEEEEEQRKLGNSVVTLEWFTSLSYDEKSKYIGRGHQLTNDQFNLLWENKSLDLLGKYVGMGRRLLSKDVVKYPLIFTNDRPDFQLVTTLSNKKLKETYLRARALYAGQGDQEGIGELVPQEVKEMSAAQIKQAKQNIKDRSPHPAPREDSEFRSNNDLMLTADDDTDQALKLALKAGFEDLAKDFLRYEFTTRTRAPGVRRDRRYGPGGGYIIFPSPTRQDVATGVLKHERWVIQRAINVGFEDMAKDLIQQKFDAATEERRKDDDGNVSSRTTQEIDAIELALIAARTAEDVVAQKAPGYKKHDRQPSAWPKVNPAGLDTGYQALMDDHFKSSEVRRFLDMRQHMIGVKVTPNEEVSGAPDRRAGDQDRHRGTTVAEMEAYQAEEAEAAKEAKAQQKRWDDSIPF